MLADRRRSQAAQGLGKQEENSVPMMAIFGGAFGLLLVFLLVVNLMSNAAVRERLEQIGERGVYRINWERGGAGFVVIVFPNDLRIIETGDSVSQGRICDAGSPFVDYARRVYDRDRKRLIFVLLESSVRVMAEARECLRRLMPNRFLTISWIMADNELLKSVKLNDIPPYIQEYVDEK